MLLGMRYSLCFFLSAALGGTPAIASAQMHAPTPMTKSQFENATAGSSVQIMVRVVARQRDTLRGDLLEAIGSSRYKDTGTRLELYLPADTALVMGSTGDVKTGAILYVYAVVTGRNQADVKKAVVVTPYATVV